MSPQVLLGSQGRLHRGVPIGEVVADTRHYAGTIVCGTVWGQVREKHLCLEKNMGEHRSKRH